MSVIAKLILLPIMIFCHIVDDYYLQGILSKMKQRNWWTKNAPDGMYKNDYVMALFEHAFSWSFMIALPLLVVAVYMENTNLMVWIFISYFINTPIHALTDTCKANHKSLNLVEDQTIHLTQVCVLWFLGIQFL